MVGILKALRTDDSAENNTHAFSILIAFSGGIWCTCYFFFMLYDWLIVHTVDYSGVLPSMVLPRKAPTRHPASTRYFVRNARVRAAI